MEQALWMYALNRLTMASGDSRYNNHAMVLAKAIHSAFVYLRGSNRPRMAWKMSIDLDHALVRSEGNLDPIDGYVVFGILQDTDGSTKLKDEMAEYRKILDTKWKGYSSDDPLDLGMTLWTAHSYEGEEEWATALMGAAEKGMKELYGNGGLLERSIKERLAFREFGSALGIRCSKNNEIGKYAEQIITAWEDEGRVPVPQKRNLKSMEPIDCVMYAASLVPGAFKKGYLESRKVIRSDAIPSRKFGQ